MLADLGSRSNHLPSIPAADQKSPYLLQYKVFEERLKRQERKGKSSHHGTRNKTAKSHLHEDYMELTRNILSRKQNLNLFQDVPCQTEPSISYNGCSEELAIKTRMLFQQKLTSKKPTHTYTHTHNSKPFKDQTQSEYKQNLSYKSRTGSESNSYLLKEEKEKAKNKEISFLGYKKNKRPIIELGFKRVLGFI